MNTANNSSADKVVRQLAGIAPAWPGFNSNLPWTRGGDRPSSATQGRTLPTDCMRAIGHRLIFSTIATRHSA